LDPPSTIIESTPVSFPADPFPSTSLAPPVPSENPVWSGWDVLQIAGLTLFTLFVVQLLIVLGARHFVFPHLSWLEVAQKPSLALLSEAGHNVSDFLALALSLGAIYLQARPPNPHKTFGYQRAGVLAAFVNAATLVIIAFLIFWTGEVAGSHSVAWIKPPRTIRAIKTSAALG